MAKKSNKKDNKKNGYKITINKKTLPLDYLCPVHPDVHKKMLGNLPTMMSTPRGK